MDPAALWTAIRNRALIDTGAGGLFAAGSQLITEIYENQTPQGAQMPYIVYDLEFSTQDDAFRQALYHVQVRFSVWVKKDNVVSTEATTTASKIIGRLRGDWQDQTAGTQPTFGYHRWSKGALDTGEWSIRDMRHVDSRSLHESDALRYVETYRLLCQQAGA